MSEPKYCPQCGRNIGIVSRLSLCDICRRQQRAVKEETYRIITILNSFKCENYPDCQDSLGSGSPCNDCNRIDDMIVQIKGDKNIKESQMEHSS